MNHTKEPWEVTNSGHGGIGMIEGDNHSFVAEVDGRTAQEIMANTSRIVACVNACADVDDDKLSFGYVKGLEAEVERLDNLVMMQNLTIAKLSEPAENGGYSGTSVPQEDV